MFHTNAAEARRGSFARVNTLSDAPTSDLPNGNKHSNPKNHRFWWFLLVLLSVSFGLLMANEHFLEEKDGKAWLAPWRKAKLKKELEDMEYGEQYVLIAEAPGFYPCYHCKNSAEIFLNTGEIWKYGVTSKDKMGRYGSDLPFDGLSYVVEYQGLLQECYKREKIQIYYYALLPENLERAIRLIRPPGNKQDN